MTDPQADPTPSASADTARRRRSTRRAADRPRQRSGGRRVVRHLALTGAGVVGIVTVGAVAALGGVATDRLPSPVLADPVQHLTVAPAQDALVCPGPARLTDQEAVGDAQFAPAPVGTESVVRALVEGGGSASLASLDGGGATALEGSGDDADVAAATVAEPDGGTVLTVLPGDAGRPRVAASTGSVTTAGDLRGLVAASCARPGISRWLVGGSTEIGSSAQLVLQNPGLTPATVTVRVWGQGGPAVLEGGGQRLVGPGEEVVTLVEAVAPEQRRMVVHVESTGGLVSAYLQHSTLDGLVPLGVDDVVAGAEPARAVALSGVESVGEAVDDPHAPRLRLLAPGDAAGTADVVVHGPDGTVPLRGVEEVALTPGVVTDVSLGGLPAGRYSVSVRADVPVVAGASVDRRGEPAPDLLQEVHQYDRAWVAAVPLERAGATDDGSERAGQVALVPGTSPSLSLAALPLDDAADATGDPAGRLELTVRLYAADGALLGEEAVDVAAGTTAVLDPRSLQPEGSTAEPGTVTVDVTGGPDDLAPVWSLLASAGPPSGADGDTTPSLVSVLLPLTDGTAAREVAVRASDTAGLGS